MSDEVDFKSADQVPHVTNFTAIIGEDLKVKLDSKELEKLKVSKGDLVEVTVSKIPDKEENENNSDKSG